MRSRSLGWRAGIVVALLCAFQSAAAAPLPLYDQVGADKKGDGQFMMATDVPYPECETGFSCGKYDLLSLEVARDASTVHFKVVPLLSYGGTSGVMYVVHFQAAGKKLYTCWNVHSAGTTTDSHDAQENAFGCDRFAGETRVGPATRADGVDAPVTGEVWIDWGVPKTAIGDAKEFTNVVVELWSRGPSTCCPGSGAPASYLWNVGDRAPDVGTWSWSFK